MISGALHIPVDACPCKHWTKTDVFSDGHAEGCPNSNRVAVDLEWLMYEIGHMRREGNTVSEALDILYINLVKGGPSARDYTPRPLDQF